MRQASRLPVIALLLLATLSALTLTTGEVAWEHAWSSALDRLRGESSAWSALLDERLPRLIVLISTGASLAVAGSVMQSLFQNPLASPAVLGITFGGSLAALLAFISGAYLIYPQLIPMAATAGCLATLWAVTSFSRGAGANRMQALILHGIAITTVLVATQRALLYALRDNWHLVQTVTEWEAGSSMNRTWRHVHMQAPLTLVGLTGCCRYLRELNILSLGEEEARHLGVEVALVRRRLFLSVALLSAGALAGVGGLAFFGLVLPHVVRRVVGPDNIKLVPLCALIGGGALVALDLALRIGHIHMFSLGNISAILGGAFFLLLLLQERRSRCYA